MLHHLLLNTFAGWLAGTLCSLGGAVKDSPLEGFKRSTFPRSMVIATFWGLVSTALTADFFLAFAFAGYFERLTVEGWKIARAKRPGKFIANGIVQEWGLVYAGPILSPEAVHMFPIKGASADSGARIERR